MMENSDVKKDACCGVELHLPANPKMLVIARQTTHQVADLVGFGESDADSITLAVEEALTNVIRHGYGGPCAGAIILNFRPIVSEGGRFEGLEISIRDYGKSVNPDFIKGRDLDDVKPGGLGVHIIKSVMDQIEYVPQDGNGMLLKMQKFIKHRSGVSYNQKETT